MMRAAQGVEPEMRYPCFSSAARERGFSSQTIDQTICKPSTSKA